MEDVPVDETFQDPESYIEFLRENGADVVADYLETVYEDYHNGDFADAEAREFGVRGADISSIIDVSVYFGRVWGNTEEDEN